jgi:hypothetical protein
MKFTIAQKMWKQRAVTLFSPPQKTFGKNVKQNESLHYSLRPVVRQKESFGNQTTGLSRLGPRQKASVTRIFEKFRRQKKTARFLYFDPGKFGTILHFKAP